MSSNYIHKLLNDIYGIWIYNTFSIVVLFVLSEGEGAAVPRLSDVFKNFFPLENKIIKLESVNKP